MLYDHILQQHGSSQDQGHFFQLLCDYLLAMKMAYHFVLKLRLSKQWKLFYHYDLKVESKKGYQNDIFEDNLPKQFGYNNDQYLVTGGSKFPFNCSKGLVVVLNREILIRSLGYFYLKASNEVKKYCNKKQYAKISEEKSGILYYSGRILPSQEFTNKLDLSDVCIDLSTSTFCVPLVDKYSPLAYAIINEIHWYHDDARHSGDDTVFPCVQQIAHILDG